jgi:hypothetical protein
MATLLDSANLALDGDFRKRVAAAAVKAALAVASEVVSETQAVSFTGTVTGGTFTLTYAGQTTPAQPFNVSAAALQVALQALTTVGAGNVVVGGGPGPAAFAVTFAGTLANSPQPLLTFNAATLTGTTPGMAVARSTAGVSFAGHAARAALANRILNNPTGYGVLMAPGVADSATVGADFTVTNGQVSLAAGKTEATVTTDINAQMSAIFNAFS